MPNIKITNFVLLKFFKYMIIGFTNIKINPIIEEMKNLG